MPQSECVICSHKGQKKAVYHTHYSSPYLRSLVTPTMSTAQVNYACPTCMKTHVSAAEDERLKILMTDSYLHEFWIQRSGGPLYEGDAIHVDHVSIPGARVSDLLHAWKCEFRDETRAMDVVLLAGFNNLLRPKQGEGFAGTQLFSEMVDFKSTVLAQGIIQDYEVDNTFVVGTLPYPPQLCRLPGQEQVPHSEFVNHYDTIYWLNNKIQTMNYQTGDRHAPTFHQMGIRVENKVITDKFGNKRQVHTQKYRWGDWRETDPLQKLHLADPIRMKMGRKVVKYFQKCT